MTVAVIDNGVHGEHRDLDVNLLAIDEKCHQRPYDIEDSDTYDYAGDHRDTYNRFRERDDTYNDHAHTLQA